MTTPTETEQSKQLEAIGFSLQCSKPKGRVGDNEWPSITYLVTLSFKDKPLIQTEYSLGVGHVDIKKVNLGTVFPACKFTEDEKSMLFAWQSQPHASFKNKALQADVAAKVAELQKVTPTLAGVMYSLLLDGSPFFYAQSFEDWADEFGYDKDSRKAEAIYRQCDATGRKLSALPKEILEQAREITKDL